MSLLPPSPSRQFMAKPDLFGEAVSCSMKPEPGHVLAMPGMHRVPFRPMTSFLVSRSILGPRAFSLPQHGGANFSRGSAQEA